jgi:hypothetical protein
MWGGRLPVSPLFSGNEWEPAICRFGSWWWDISQFQFSRTGLDLSFAEPDGRKFVSCMVPQDWYKTSRCLWLLCGLNVDEGILWIMPKPSNPRVAALAAVREELGALPAPIVVFNKSHSGSRLLARLLEEGGIFMGAHRNGSGDSVDVLKLVEYLVTQYYPDYAPLWDGGVVDDALPELVREVFSSHLGGFSGNGSWGWKLCETSHILPVVDYLFPSARYIHLVRDGRDVAFSDHRAPNRPFWKKIYFNTDGISAWRGLKFHSRDYARRSHIYNALHWVNSVTVGRFYGAMLRERCLEVRYEDLCGDYDNCARRVLAFAGVEETAGAIEAVRPGVHQESLHKYLRQPKDKVREVVEIAKPMLLAMGYMEPDGLLDIVAERVRGSSLSP